MERSVAVCQYGLAYEIVPYTAVREALKRQIPGAACFPAQPRPIPGRIQALELIVIKPVVSFSRGQPLRQLRPATAAVPSWDGVGQSSGRDIRRALSAWAHRELHRILPYRLCRSVDLGMPSSRENSDKLKLRSLRMAFRFAAKF